MEREVIGFFDNAKEAERVRDEVVAAGINRNNVKVFSGQGAGAQETREPGFWEQVKEFFGMAEPHERDLYAEAARRGVVAVAVDADTEAEEARAAEIMQRHGPIDLDVQAQQWGWAGGSQPQQPAEQRREGEVIPVTEEQIQIGKRQVQAGGIRVYTRTTEKPVQEQVTLREEHATVERRPADRPATKGEEPFQERVIEVTETREEPVVAKEARVVEEVVVSKDVGERTETVQETVRRTDVDVEKLGPEEQARFAESYGDELYRDERYRGRDWNAIEAEVRGDFERRYPGSRWDRFRDRIRSRYEQPGR